MSHLNINSFNGHSAKNGSRNILPCYNVRVGRNGPPHMLFDIVIKEKTEMEKTNYDHCRPAYEEYVDERIKGYSHSEYLKVGSAHWLDFKAGWYAREVACRKAFEVWVGSCIRPEAREKFLEDGSPHWVDFRAGWSKRETIKRTPKKGWYVDEKK